MSVSCFCVARCGCVREVWHNLCFAFFIFCTKLVINDSKHVIKNDLLEIARDSSSDVMKGFTEIVHYCKSDVSSIAVKPRTLGGRAFTSV